MNTKSFDEILKQRLTEDEIKEIEKEVGSTRVQMRFDGTLDLRAEIKVAAARRNMSMSQWITRVLVEQLKKEKQYNS